MKLKHLFILLFALPFLGCDGPENLTHHYIYGNATDKTVSVQAFRHLANDNEYRDIRAKFTLQPGEKFTLSYFPVGRWGEYSKDPFNWSNEMIISNEDTTIVHTRKNISRVYRSLLINDTYSQNQSKNGKTVYFEFVFTDQDFQGKK